MVKVRKVLYTSKGYLKGEYLGEFNGDIVSVYDRFSKLWMNQNSSAEETLGGHISEDDVNYADEFTYCGEDSFCVGVRNGIMYEGVVDGCELFPGAVVDRHGFELMADVDGNIIEYTKITQSS